MLSALTALRPPSGPRGFTPPRYGDLLAPQPRVSTRCFPALPLLSDWRHRLTWRVSSRKRGVFGSLPPPAAASTKRRPLPTRVCSFESLCKVPKAPSADFSYPLHTWRTRTMKIVFEGPPSHPPRLPSISSAARFRQPPPPRKGWIFSTSAGRISAMSEITSLRISLSSRTPQEGSTPKTKTVFF